MRTNHSHPTAPALVLFATLTAGCESEQDAVPLSQSVPVALLLFVSLPLLWAGLHLLLRCLGRAIGRRLSHHRTGIRLRWPRLTAGLAAAPVVVSVAVMWTVGCFHVAFAYEERTYDMFSWDESVAIIAFFGGFGVIVGVLSTLVACALWSGGRRGVIASRCVLLLVVVVLAASGAGVLWLPALILSFVTAPDDETRGWSADALEVGRVVEPHEPPTTGWAPPGLVGIGAVPVGE